MEQQQQILLDPDAVRLRASSIPGCIEIKPSSLSSSSIQPSLMKVTNDNNNNDDNDLKYICSFIVGYNNNNNNNEPGSTLLTNPFLLLDQQQQQQQRNNNNNIQNLARVTIYCTTGTIAIGRILYNNNTNHNNNNNNNNDTISSSSSSSKNDEIYKIRHIFRKNVSSLDIVERCLRQPTEIQAIDWNLIYNNNDNTNNTTTNNQNNNNTNNNQNTHHYLSITNNLELMNIGIAILNSEREKLIQHVYTIEQQTKVQEIQQQLQSSSVNTTTVAQSQSSLLSSTRTGTEFQFSLAINPMKHVDQCLNDIQQMNKYVTWVTTNGIGTIFLYGNGGVAYTPNIPLLLYQHLIQLRSNTSGKSKVRNHRPKYIVLGTNERFFVIFYNNTYYYNINNKKYKNILDTEIQKIITTNQPPLLSIAFGKYDDTIFIIYSNGTYQYYGKSIPYDLIQCLTTLQKNSNNNTLRLSSVALGPNNEWFIRKQPSSMNHNIDNNDNHNNEQLIYYGNISYEMELAIRDIINDGHVIQYLDFGENYSYFISYD